jgi:vacuolar-type H+-ATPase subunit I/STV1
MEVKKSRWEIVGEFILENLPWIFIIIGIASLLLGFIDFGPGRFLSTLPNILKTIGSTILGSGIFASVLKSFQFTGVFKKAVAQVI